MVRMPKAYPVYDDVYRRQRGRHPHAGSRSTPPTSTRSGRNGMHKYNNQDHSMYTAMLTVENIRGAHHDIWSVNVEEEYHEVNDERPGPGDGPATAPTGRDAPVVPRQPTVGPSRHVVGAERVRRPWAVAMSRTGGRRTARTGE